jgi:hypothetical protein
VTDPVLIDLGRSAVRGIGDKASPAGTIPGDIPGGSSLSAVWQALHDSLTAIDRQATAREKASDAKDSGPEDAGETGSGASQ